MIDEKIDKLKDWWKNVFHLKSESSPQKWLEDILIYENGIIPLNNNLNKKIETNIWVEETTYDENNDLTIILTDNEENPLPNKELVITINDSSSNYTTGNDGTITINPYTLTNDNSDFEISFEGDNTYKPSSYYFIGNTIDLLKYSLHHYYPKRSITYENIYYPSLNEKYIELTNITYVNGTLYISEDISNLSTISRERSINTDCAYIIISNRLYLSVKLNGFNKKQLINITVNYNYNNTTRTYNVSDKIYSYGYTRTPLSDEITIDNIESVIINPTNSVMENYTEYSQVPQATFNRTDNDFIFISQEDLDKLIEDNDVNLQRYTEFPQLMRDTGTFSNKTKYGFRIRNYLPLSYDNSQEISFDITTFKEIENSDEDIIETFVFKKQISSLSSSEKDILKYYFTNLEDTGEYDKIEVILFLPSHKKYTGLAIKLTYTEFTGGRYSSPSKIEYLENYTIPTN